jgi:hypothetical protein
MRRAIGAVAVGATAALIGAGAGVSVASPHASAAGPTTPTIQVTASGKHTFTVSGPTTFPAGQVELVLKSVKREHTADIVSLHQGYTFKDFRSDFKSFNKKEKQGKPKAAAKFIRRIIKNVNFFGGLDSVGGQTEKGTIDLDNPGTYYLVNDTSTPKQASTLTVSPPAANPPAAQSSATVTALTKRRFGGAKTLPAKGTITFKNKSTESPHFLVLQHVKKGTTKKQVLKGLQSSKPPRFLRKGQGATDVVGEGRSQTLQYKLPKGQYVELCFFPDPKTGMPHAFMGMLRMVTLK